MASGGQSETHSSYAQWARWRETRLSESAQGWAGWHPQAMVRVAGPERLREVDKPSLQVVIPNLGCRVGAKQPAMTRFSECAVLRDQVMTKALMR